MTATRITKEEEQQLLQLVMQLYPEGAPHRAKGRRSRSAVVGRPLRVALVGLSWVSLGSVIMTISSPSANPSLVERTVPKASPSVPAELMALPTPSPSEQPRIAAYRLPIRRAHQGLAPIAPPAAPASVDLVPAAPPASPIHGEAPPASPPEPSIAREPVEVRPIVRPKEETIDVPHEPRVAPLPAEDRDRPQEARDALRALRLR